MKRELESFGKRLRSKSTRATTGIVVETDGNTATILTIDGTRVQAYAPVPVNPGTVVLLGSEEHDPGRLRVLEVRDGAARMARHGATHTLGGDDPAPIWMLQVMDWSARAEGMTVIIQRAIARTSTGFVPGGIEIFDMMPYVPSNGARYVLLALTSNGAISITPGTIKSLSTLTLNDIPQPANAVPLWAVLVYFGQSRITISSTRSDLVDLRMASMLAGTNGNQVVLPGEKVIATLSNGAIDTNAPHWKDFLISWADAPFSFPPADFIGIRLASGNVPAVSLTRAGNDTAAGAVNFVRTGGTLSSPAAVQSGWRLGSFSFGGHTGNGIDAVKARIAAIAGENWNETARGTRLVLSATPNGSQSMVDSLEIRGNEIEASVPIKAPTPPMADNSTRLATTAYVRAVVNNIRFLLPFSSLAIPPFNATTWVHSATLPGFQIVLRRWSQGVSIGNTNNTTHYWLIEMYTDVGGSLSVIASFQTSNLPTNAVSVLTTTAFLVPILMQASNTRIAIKISPIGSPSPIWLHGPAVEYSLE